MLKIHETIPELVKRKSIHDNKNFTLHALCKAINCANSSFLRLIDPNPHERIQNPRIETLQKVINYFNSNGVRITLNELLYGINDQVENLKLADNLHIDDIVEQRTLNLPCYLLNNLNAQSFTTQVTFRLKNNQKLPSREALVCYKTTVMIEPVFLPETIFAVHKKRAINHNDLVMIKRKTTDNKLEIMKAKIHNDKKTLYPISSIQNTQPIDANTHKHYIVGIIILAFITNIH